jgi:RND family efflux transporter MFP subunit
MTPILTVADLSRLAVVVELSEFDAALVKRGLEAVVSVDALGGEEYEGEVVFAAPSGIDRNGVVIFPVRVGLKSTKGLKPGMNVSVRIIVNQKENVLQVPLDAVTREEDGATVMVLDLAGEPVVRPVKIGLANNQSVEIVRGLRAGQRVVLPEPDAGGEEE